MVKVGLGGGGRLRRWRLRRILTEMAVHDKLGEGRLLGLSSTEG